MKILEVIVLEALIEYEIRINFLFDVNHLEILLSLQSSLNL